MKGVCQVLTWFVNSCLDGHHWSERKLRGRCLWVVVEIVLERPLQSHLNDDVVQACKYLSEKDEIPLLLLLVALVVIERMDSASCLQYYWQWEKKL